MDAILKKLGIDETYTRPVSKQKAFNKVKDNIPLKANFNFMSDLLFLPTTKNGYKYLLVVVDIATNAFDIEPIKNKEPKTILEAFKTMIKRKYIKEPYASIRTDGGNEFEGVFAKWLYNENIMHKVGIPGRHQQLANVESLNRQLGRIFNGYMNAKEKATSRPYHEWDDILGTVRAEMNKFKKLPEQDIFTHQYRIPETIAPQFKVGDVVYRKSEHPLSALGKKQPTDKFREGDYRWDLVARKIVKVLSYPGAVPNRYVLDSLPNVSYAESELRPGKEKEEQFIIREIIDKKVVNKKIFYKIWWEGYKKAEASWEPKIELMKTAPLLIKQYEEDN